jgi:ABC-type cobalamin/Fe3+-siderophores transport system ATPase subunit
MRFPWLSTSRRRHYKPLLQVPFVGQQTVLTALATHLQKAQKGTIQGVTLAGQAGSGKSALLEEFIFRHCTKPDVLLLQLNAADCLLDHDVYRQLCTALQSHSEQILQKVYNATKGVRKSLSLQWDEAEFRQVLASTEWAQLSEVPPLHAKWQGRSSPP